MDALEDIKKMHRDSKAYLDSGRVKVESELRYQAGFVKALAMAIELLEEEKGE